MDSGAEFPRISYVSTYFYKRILPTLILAVYVALLLAVAQAAGHQAWQDLQTLLLVATGVASWAGLVWWFSFWRCCDEVWDAQSRLIVRRGKIIESVAIEEIADIRRSVAIRPERIELCLRSPNRLGSTIRFLIPYRQLPWGPPPLFTSLAHRVELAKHPADARVAMQKDSPSTGHQAT